MPSQSPRWRQATADLDPWARAAKPDIALASTNSSTNEIPVGSAPTRWSGCSSSRKLSKARPLLRPSGCCGSSGTLDRTKIKQADITPGCLPGYCPKAWFYFRFTVAQRQPRGASVPCSGLLQHPAGNFRLGADHETAPARCNRQIRANCSSVQF